VSITLSVEIIIEIDTHYLVDKTLFKANVKSGIKRNKSAILLQENNILSLKQLLKLFI